MAGRTTINVSLSPELGEFITARVASGRYQSASEVVRDGLRLLEERELARATVMENLRGKIDVGVKQIKSGQVRNGREVFNELKKRSRKRRGNAR